MGRRIKVRLSIGYYGADREAEIELEDDDLSDADIDEVVRDWASNFIDYSWDPIETDAEPEPSRPINDLSDDREALASAGVEEGE